MSGDGIVPKVLQAAWGLGRGAVFADLAGARVRGHAAQGADVVLVAELVDPLDREPRRVGAVAVDHGDRRRAQAHDRALALGHVGRVALDELQRERAGGALLVLVPADVGRDELALVVDRRREDDRGRVADARGDVLDLRAGDELLLPVRDLGALEHRDDLVDVQRGDLTRAVLGREERGVLAGRVAHVALERLADARERVLLAPLAGDQHAVLARTAEQDHRVGVRAADLPLLVDRGGEVAERLAGLRVGLEALVEDGDVDALVHRGDLVGVVVAVQQRELALLGLAELVLRILRQHQVRLLAVLADAEAGDLVDGDEPHEQRELQAVGDRLGTARDRRRRRGADLLGPDVESGNHPEERSELHCAYPSCMPRRAGCASPDEMPGLALLWLTGQPGCPDGFRSERGELCLSLKYLSSVDKQAKNKGLQHEKS